MNSSIADNIAAVRERIARAARRAGRSPHTITLVAVTKTVEPERIAEAYNAGLRDFGENYVQESLTKLGIPPLSLPDVNCHFIGHLQSNKAKDVAGRFALIQSVDSLTLAQSLDRAAAKRGQSIDILLEVRLDTVGAKFGFAPDAVAEAAAQIGSLENVRVRGLMGLAPFAPEPDAARPAFQELRQRFDALPTIMRQILSMGMTGDFEVAIEEGATLIRLGTAIFGRRSERTNQP